jgi:hypothetical protein
MPKIVHLISGPRNLSTALMYSFSRRSDTKVQDEPFYGHYLKVTGLDHPGKEEVMAGMDCDSIQVLSDINQFSEAPVFFLKNMAHHLIEMDLSFLSNVENLFLIRNPHQLIASFAKVIYNPTVQDVGLKHEWELFDKIMNSGKNKPIVLDSGVLLQNPQLVLTKVCVALGLSFEENMLSWPKGGIKEDGIWAKFWYANVHDSTGFERQQTSERPLPDHCLALYEEVLPYYEKLSVHAIKI